VPLDLSIFHKALKTLNKEDTKDFTSLKGSSSALLFTIIKEPCLLICPSEDSADEFHSDVIFWSKSLYAEEPILIHPKGDPLRLKNLKTLYNSSDTKVITSVEAIPSPVWYRDEFPVVRATRGSNIGRDCIIEKFKKLGYRTVSIVSAEGELSVRGGIIDIFPPDEEFPVRIEFFGDEIDSLRFFDIDTQMSIKEIEEVSISPAVEPEEGVDLLELLAHRMMILNEPDDIKRRHPQLIERLQGKRVIHFTSLPLKAEGFNLNLRGVGGFGLLPQERKEIRGFFKSVKELKNGILF